MKKDPYTEASRQQYEESPIADALANDAGELSVLGEAQRLVYGPRQASYGHPLDNFDQTAELWAPIIGQTVNAEQVALMMVMLKVSRQLHRPSRDNLVDICGYIATIERIQIRREQLARTNRQAQGVTNGRADECADHERTGRG